MFQWQVVFHARYHGGYDIMVVDANNIKEVIEEHFSNRVNDIISITKLLDY